MAAGLATMLAAVLATGTAAGERVALAEPAPPVQGVTVAAIPSHPVQEVAVGALPSVPLHELATGALPSAPSEAFIRTTRSFGNVTIDHRMHLAARARCSGCHDPGPVGKIQFTARIAHARCIGCHKERKEGPRECRGCHVVPPDEPPAPQLTQAPATATPAGATPPADGATAGPGTPAAGTPVASVEPAAAAAASRASAARWGGRTVRPGTTHLMELGAAAGPRMGGSLRVSTRRDGAYRAYGLERFENASSAWTLALMDFGMEVPIRDRLGLVAAWVVGLDLEDRPDVGLTTVLGARARVEWIPPARWPIRLAHASLTFLGDPLPGAIGRHSNDARIFVTLGCSVGLGQRALDTGGTMQRIAEEDDTNDRPLPAVVRASVD